MRKLVLIVPFALFACATPYQRSGLRGGFSDTQLKENVFRVYFRGNGFSDAARTADFALLHGAELALEHGYPFFAIANEDSMTLVAATNNGRYGSDIMVAPSSRNTIVCYQEKPSDAGALVYEAAFIRKTLRAKYDIQ
jgi:hypothetical protein